MSSRGPGLCASRSQVVIAGLLHVRAAMAGWCRAGVQEDDQAAQESPPGVHAQAAGITARGARAAAPLILRVCLLSGLRRSAVAQCMGQYTPRGLSDRRAARRRAGTARCA